MPDLRPPHARARIRTSWRPRAAPRAAIGRARAGGLAPAALLAALAACAGTPERTPSGDPKPDGGGAGSLAGAPIEIPDAPEWLEILRLEDERSSGDGRLQQILVLADDARIRARAAFALGRLPLERHGPEVTDPLSAALEDDVPGVRRAAAFSLGMRADPASAGVLAAYRNDPDPLLRARCIEALSKLEDPRLHRDVLLALRDADVRVRDEAAVGAARWDPEAADADEVDRALLDALRPYEVGERSSRLRKREIESELAWRVLYALSRRRSELARGAFLEYADSAAPLERLFAVRGLAAIPPDAETVAALARALADARPGGGSDWRVAYEATVGLGAARDPAALPSLLGAVEHPSAHVRAAVQEALGAMPDRRKEVGGALRRGFRDVSPAVRVAAAKAIVHALDPEDALPIVAELAASEDACLRAGAAEAAADLPEDAGLPLLRDLVRDRTVLVAVRAVEALAQHPRPEVRAALHALLEHADNGIRLAAVLALREMPDPADVEPLAEAYRTSRGDIAGEIAFNVVRNLGELAVEPARALVREAALDPRPYVRRVARETLRSKFGEEVPPGSPPPPGPHASPPFDQIPRWRRNPIVEVVTTRGSMLFELFPAEAPVHVQNFLELTVRGEYDRLPFHRVVPDFVIQGGDYRGDGNGSQPAWGDSLRHEIGMRKFVRGSLGMPRNEDVESGGSQFFVTHRPTPHLDGRYTLFGELRDGGDVLDSIQPGDWVVEVRMPR